MKSSSSQNPNPCDTAHDLILKCVEAAYDKSPDQLFKLEKLARESGAFNAEQLTSISEAIKSAKRRKAAENLAPALTKYLMGEYQDMYDVGREFFEMNKATKESHNVFDDLLETHARMEAKEQQWFRQQAMMNSSQNYASAKPPGFFK
jgi:hypothetical protein